MHRTSLRERHRDNMTAFLVELVRNYGAQMGAYQRILQTVTREREALRTGEPLSEILKLLRAKQRLLQHVEMLDRSIAVEREMFDARRDELTARETFLVNDAIRSIKKILSEILEIEKQNDDVIAARGVTLPR